MWEVPQPEPAALRRRTYGGRGAVARPLPVLMAVVLALGCSGRETGTTSGTSGHGADAGGSSADMDASTVGDASAPLYHRATHATCPSQRARGNFDPAICPTPPPPRPYCCSDSDCDGGTNGRCIDFGRPGQQCTYDECFTDSNCPSGTPCICRSSPTDSTANTCEPGGDCVVDSDCGGHYCSPSPVPEEEECGETSPYLFPYYCHTATDTCVDDSDCFVDGGGVGFCLYDPPARRWACSTSPGCPP
jgi:hypothetical protein